MTSDYILLNGIDVTRYRIQWTQEEQWKQAIPILTIEFSKNILEVVNPDTSANIQVYRTINTLNDDYVFYGEVTQAKPQSDRIICECKGRLIEAIKASQTKSWDKDIDIEAGVGSEIFKSLVTHSNLTYSSASIISTGLTPDKLITKFIQRDEDDYDRMNVLATQYNYIIRYNNSDNLVYFQPEGYSVYPYTLTVGKEIPTAIKWKENKEQLVNKVIIFGATVFDTLVETFGGPASTFDLSKTPEDTEVRIGGSAGTLQTRGSKGVGILGTDHTYEIDVELKTLIFATNQSNVYIKYSTQVPCPITLKNEISINLYGGPLKTPSVKKFTYTDIKNLADAEARGRAILNKYSIPFIETQGVKVTDTQTKLQVLKPGDLIHLIDPFSNKDIQVFVKTVRKTYPQPMDEIDIGDEIWRTENWQADQMKKINELFNELNKNQSILTQVLDFEHDINFERRYAVKYSRNVAIDGAWNVGFGDRSTGTHYPLNWNDANAVWGDGTYTNSLVLKSLVQGNNIYTEYFYDTDFKDAGTTGNWNVTTNTLTLNSGGQLVLSSSIHYGSTVTSVKLVSPLSVWFDGPAYGSNATDFTNLVFETTADGGSHWETLTQGLKHTFTNSGTDLRYRITNNRANNIKLIPDRVNLNTLKFVVNG